MKKFMLMVTVIAMSLFITGFKASAAEKEDFYTIVKNGVEEDIDHMEENEMYDVQSVKTNEYCSERVYVAEVRFVSDGTQYRLWVYLDEYQDEAIAILYNGDNEVEDQSHLTLRAAASDYI